MRLIDADELIAEIQASVSNRFLGTSEYRAFCIGRVKYAEEWIAKAPTVDAVPVVRCRDCAHWKPCEVKGFEGKKYCEWAGWLVGENAYCVYGEVKSNESE